MKFTIKFEPRDIWIGLYWTCIEKNGWPRKSRFRFYLCIVPCFPIIWEAYL